MFLSMFSFCNCDEPEHKSHLDDDNFPSVDQIWGMIGTIVTTVACWLVYSRVKSRRARLEEQRHTRVEELHHKFHHKAKIPTNARRTRK